jgi:HrpA-like RNA helicase
VAEERGEALGQGNVGYMIRGENKSNPSTRLLFCTTGIILRRLQETQGTALHNAGISHLVLDEVHERSLDSDLLLALLLRLLPQCPNLTVILMSATMDADRLARYFAPVCSNRPPPILHIPGFTYPVTDLWLDDVMGPSLLSLPPTHPLHRSIENDKGKVGKKNAA